MKLQIIMENDEDYFTNKEYNSKSPYIKHLTNKINALVKLEDTLFDKIFKIKRITPVDEQKLEKLRVQRFETSQLLQNLKMERIQARKGYL